MVITMIAVSIPVIFSIEEREKKEVCKYVQKGKCYIDDMADKLDCTGKGHDLEHCGDYHAYKADENKTTAFREVIKNLSKQRVGYGGTYRS